MTTASAPTLSEYFILTAYPEGPFHGFDAAAARAAEIVAADGSPKKVVLIERVCTGAWCGEVNAAGVVRY